MPRQSPPPRAAATVLALLIALTGPAAFAQDIQPAPADVEAVRGVMKAALTALKTRDSKGFVACCDDYVDVFFLDGTLIKGKKKIALTLHEFFQNRSDDFAATLDALPRSFRVLSPDIVMVDWPATVNGPDVKVRVNTLTTLRKVEGKWSITSYLESVPYERRLGGRNAVPKGEGTP